MSPQSRIRAIPLALAALAAGCDLHDVVSDTTTTSSGTGGTTTTETTPSSTTGATTTTGSESTGGTGGAGAGRETGTGGTGAMASGSGGTTTTTGSGGTTTTTTTTTTSMSSSGSGGSGPVCPDTKGVYCGGSVPNGLYPEGSALKLYTCVDGVFAVQKTCSLGCNASGPGLDDKCEAGAACPALDGGYCGQHMVGGSPLEGYCCAAGKLTLKKVCNGGQACVQKPSGQHDCCPEQMVGGLCPNDLCQ
jgi:hypothetical protein